MAVLAIVAHVNMAELLASPTVLLSQLVLALATKRISGQQSKEKKNGGGDEERIKKKEKKEDEAGVRWAPTEIFISKVCPHGGLVQALGLTGDSPLNDVSLKGELDRS
ncbi:hypothetical protein PoB_000430700 [Plakobranchus ocellatus]|uniref:Uncharacterized protein n=1 Tax=Plakobranchus ocellatus TaxID=259542 RepID=A0AAV3Y5S2_9GAST|nr:hypothetical protein PoB_000430700 [Plakobranchus ocellatus]